MISVSLGSGPGAGARDEGRSVGEGSTAGGTGDPTVGEGSLGLDAGGVEIGELVQDPPRLGSEWGSPAGGAVPTPPDEEVQPLSLGEAEGDDDMLTDGDGEVLTDGDGDGDGDGEGAAV